MTVIAGSSGVTFEMSVSWMLSISEREPSLMLSSLDSDCSRRFSVSRPYMHGDDREGRKEGRRRQEWWEEKCLHITPLGMHGSISHSTIS